MNHTSINDITNRQKHFNHGISRQVINKLNPIVLVLLLLVITLSFLATMLIRRNNDQARIIIELQNILGNETLYLNDQDVSSAVSQVAPAITLVQDYGFTHKQVDSCSSSGCLFERSSVPEGYARLSGYYYEYETDSWGTLTTCTGFVVTNGNTTLVDHFNDWIAKGNTLNKIIDDKLVINIYLDDLTLDVKDVITSSNEGKPIELGVLRVTPVGRGSSSCGSVVEIVSARPSDIQN